MEIIDRIEIKYFRSIYSIWLKNLNNINILVGGNDAGKSNVLKALNLFFNNETELGNPFIFREDLSRLRERQARDTKGRAIIWIRITFNNFLKWRSLPEHIVVKRTWNRYQDEPDTKVQTPDIPNTTISKFLNKISFHYVPAVRGRDIFLNYLQLLYESLLDNEEASILESSTSLISSVNTSTKDMSARIKKELGFDSSIQMPTELRGLFLSLDFSTKFNGYDLPLPKRGDGIQARHIPFILDFIARHSNKTHIWAYEEPENSLELLKAFELAEQFLRDFSKSNQIIITTHSPAFYDLKGERVSKWLIEMGAHRGSAEPVTVANSLAVSTDADERLGIAALISDRARELYDEKKRLEHDIANLNDQIHAATRPQVIVEGPTDKIILETAYEKLYPGDAIAWDFVPSSGANGVVAFIQASAKIKRKKRVPLLGLLDHDHGGRDALSKLRRFKSFNGNMDIKIVNITEEIYCLLLPMPARISELGARIKDGTLIQNSVPVPIEFLFPETYINKAAHEGVLSLIDSKIQVRSHLFNTSINMTNQLAEQLPSEYRYLLQEVDDSSKAKFAVWISKLPKEAFHDFLELFNRIRLLTNRNS